MDEQRVEIPDSLWERLRARPGMLLAIALLVALVLGGAAYAIVRSGASGGSRASMSDLEDIDAQDGDSEAPGGADASVDETRSADATPSGEATTSGSAGGADPGDGSDGGDGGGGGGGKPGDEAGDPAPTRAPYIAYRKDGALWVAHEDGSAPRSAAPVASGTFALSPDARTLAYVDAASEKLHLVDMSGDAPADREAGPAKDVRLSWAADSSAVAFTRVSDRYEVCVIAGDGSNLRVVGSGHTPSFSLDGKRLAFVGNSVPGQTGSVLVTNLDGEGGGIGVRANEVVWGGDGLIVAVARESEGTARILTMAQDGSGYRELLGTPSSEGKPVTYAALGPSPDGALLAYAATGDDGYSRAFVTGTENPNPVSLSVRRDTYPLCWSADGSRVAFVEGNAFQGERTSVMSAKTDGTGRVVLVDAAGH